jgi:hypothetical protein
LAEKAGIKMKALTKIETITVRKGKRKIYVASYADNKTAQRVRKIVKDLVPKGFEVKDE